VNLSRGFWTIARFGGAPLRLHWTLPLGAFFMGGFQFAPAYWLGFVLLILIHEIGHALIVLRYRLRLVEIVVHGVGGYCSHAPARTAFQESAIAWGGVLAQFTALLLALLLRLFAGPPSSLHAAQLWHVFIQTNAWLIAINLIPIEPLDGRKAWPLLGMLWQRLRQTAPPQPAARERRTVSDELRDLEKLGETPENETPSQRTDRIVRELIARTTQSKSGR
jgi:stage IV sporulation protein FB